LIRRKGGKVIKEPVTKPTDIVELLAEWKKEGPLGPKDQFPEIEDLPASPDDIFSIPVGRHRAQFP
jgi:antitoxin VapB